MQSLMDGDVVAVGLSEEVKILKHYPKSPKYRQGFATLRTINNIFKEEKIWRVIGRFNQVIIVGETRKNLIMYFTDETSAKRSSIVM